MKYYLHYVGSKLYPKEVFIEEAKKLGVNRCLPINMIGKLKWNDRILLGTYTPKVIKEQKEYYFDARFIGLQGMLGGKVLKDGDKTGEYLNHFYMEGVNINNPVWITKDILKDKKTKDITPNIDKRKNKRDGIAEVFGYFIISGINLNASEEFKKELISQLDITETKELNSRIQRRCGSYSISSSHIVKNTLEDIINKIKVLKTQRQEKVKIFVGGRFYSFKTKFEPINFSRTFIPIEFEKNLLIDYGKEENEVGFIFDYNKRAYIKKYAKRGRPKKGG